MEGALAAPEARPDALAAQTEAEERARAGAPEGFCLFAVTEAKSARRLQVALVLRPKVPMGCFQSLPAICALGAAEGLEPLVGDAAISWPDQLVWDGRRLVSLALHAGYGEGGMFAVAEAALALDGVPGASEATLEEALAGAPLPQPDALSALIQEALAASSRRWEKSLAAGAAAPLAPVLEEYFERLWLMGEEVEARFPNGNIKARGRFAGVDIWGRATIVCASGQEIELSAAEAKIFPCA